MRGQASQAIGETRVVPERAPPTPPTPPDTADTRALGCLVPAHSRHGGPSSQVLTWCHKGAGPWTAGGPRPRPRALTTIVDHLRRQVLSVLNDACPTSSSGHAQRRRRQQADEPGTAPGQRLQFQRVTGSRNPPRQDRRRHTTLDLAHRASIRDWSIELAHRRLPEGRTS